MYTDDDSIRTRSNIDTVLSILNDNHYFTKHDDLVDRFWDMFVIDGFIGNTDRNTNNFGLLQTSQGYIKFAPIYDCGSSLSALVSENNMRIRMTNDNLFKREEFNVYMCLRKNRNRILFSDYLKTPPLDLARAIKRIVPKINMADIVDLVHNTEGMSEIYYSSC